MNTIKIVSTPSLIFIHTFVIIQSGTISSCSRRSLTFTEPERARSDSGWLRNRGTVHWVHCQVAAIFGLLHADCLHPLNAVPTGH